MQYVYKILLIDEITIPRITRVILRGVSVRALLMRKSASSLQKILPGRKFDCALSSISGDKATLTGWLRLMRRVRLAQ